MDFHRDVCITRSVHQALIHQRNSNSDLLGIIHAVAQDHTASRCPPTRSCSRILAGLFMPSTLSSFICIYSTNGVTKINSRESLFSRLTDLQTRLHATRSVPCKGTQSTVGGHRWSPNRRKVTQPALTGRWGVRERKTRKQEREVLSRRGNKGSEIKTCLCQDSGNVYTVARELGATCPPTLHQLLALHPPPEWKTAPSKSYPFSRRTRDLLPSGNLSGLCVKQMGASLPSILYIAIQNL